ncbi:MAG: PEP-CTERM/exosortase system-associated acyltransferase [Nitrospinota bacterium]
MNTLSEAFNANYKIVSASSEELLKESQRLRYQVFCAERTIFDGKNFKEGLETDEFDSRSIHSFIRSNETGLAVASVRLVLADTEELSKFFPIEKYCGVHLKKGNFEPGTFSRESLAEISRFAISKEHSTERERSELFGKRGPRPDRRVGKDDRRKNHMRRSGEEGKRNGELIEKRGDMHGYVEWQERSLKERRMHPERRFFSYLTLGLTRAILQMGAEKNITHVYACMEPSLCRLLKRYGFFFKPVGPTVDYFGKRQPCFASAEELLEGVFNERPDIWDFITDGGRLWSFSSGHVLT